MLQIGHRYVPPSAQLTAAQLKRGMPPFAAGMLLFLLDRSERFGGEMGAVWLPGQDSNLQPSG